MAGHDYEYTHEGNQNNWSAPYTNEWTKPNYDIPEHVCRPVIMDAQGRRRPIISYSPPNSHSTPEGHYKEKIIERIHYTVKTPVIQEHRVSPHEKIDPHVENYKDDSYTRAGRVHQFKVHQHANDGNYKGDSHPKPLVHLYKVHPHADGEHYKDDTYTRPVSHENKIHPLAKAKHDPYVETYKEGNYTRPHHSVHPHDNNSDHHHHIPHAKKDHGYDQYSFNKPSSPEARRPNGNKFGLLSATHWRNMPHQHQRSREEGKLSGPTNNIGEAMMMLKEAAEPMIDSRDAARRYGSSSPPSRMYGADYGHHGPSLSSREAAKKYNGTHFFPA